jgi:xylulokinase
VLAEAGARPRQPMLVGGGARSAFWGQMIADVTGLTIELAAGAEAGAALGAARLAMLAAGAGDEDAVCVRPPIQRQFVPDAASAAIHAPRLRRFRALYAAEKATRGGDSGGM